MNTAAVLAATGRARAQLAQLEQLVRAVPQLDYDTTHTFGPGFYARTVRLPAGAVAIGKVHKTEHLFFVTEGECTLSTDEGPLRVGAGYQAIGRAGSKRAVWCHSDCVITNVHMTTETNLVRLEAELIEAESLPAPGGVSWLG